LSDQSRWVAHREALRRHEDVKVSIRLDEQGLSFDEVIGGWRDNAAFRSFFIAALAAICPGGFFWEMPPIRRGQTRIPFEYVAIAYEGFDRLWPEDRAFRSKLDTLASASSIAAFGNRGGDAVLIVPKRLAAADAYGHIAAFLRLAPAEQVHELLQVLAREVEAALAGSDQPIWISTSGLGVPWLHVRIDSAPKYYSHIPYRSVGDAAPGGNTISIP
jgi:hypothetical protein